MPTATASHIERFDLSAARIWGAENGAATSIRVNSILVSNASANDVELVFEDQDGTAIVNFSVQAHSSFSWDVCFLADKGLTIDSLSDSDVVVTVARSAPGA